MATPIEYGRRLIPQILDDLASKEPERIIYSVAKSPDISQGFLEIEAGTFAKAVDKVAWWLHNELGNSATIRPIGYIGPHDIRHVLLTYAACKAGYTALFLSPKNSVEGALAVLTAAECEVWVQPREQSQIHLIQDLLKQRPMKVLQLPETASLLDVDDSPPFPYNKTFDEAALDPFCILHTSGSTGLPKPSVWSHALLGTTDAVRLLPPTDGDLGMSPWTKGWEEKDRIYSSFPMSHAAGMFMDIVMPAFYGLHCILGPAGVIPNLDLIDSLVQKANISIWSMVPSLVDELGETPDVLAKFKSAKFICASGGPTNPPSASKVNKLVRVLNITGTTEGLFTGNLWVDREDWLWFAFHPWSGFEFRELEPGVYEHWVRRNEHWRLFQGIFHTFPDKNEINLKDLYVKHPSTPGLWAYKGRSDDVVVLSNGYKISPLDTEASITAHPAVSGCLMIGSGWSQAGLLIELKDPTAKNNEEVVDSIWSVVEKANESSMHKGQLHRDYMMFAEEDTPFVRTDKGTVKRRATLELYRDHIQRFYDEREKDSEMQLSITVDTSSEDSVLNAVTHVVRSLAPAFADAAPDTDLFSLGLDSLMVFRLIKTIRSLVGLQEELATRHVYANPTISKFSNALIQLLTRVKNGEDLGPESDNTPRVKELLDKYRPQQSMKMNPFDMMTIKIYQKLVFCLPLKEGIAFDQAFSGLQKGLTRLFSLLPSLDSKVELCPEQDAETRQGQVQMVPPASEHDARNPRQLVFKDLSKVLPSFSQLQATGFVGSTFPKDELILEAPWFPPHPTDAMLAQANFIEGGCLLATAFHHSCFDGVGVVTVMKAWAECCRFVLGDQSATCSWIDPESMNRSLPRVLWELEGYSRPVEDIDPGTWGFLSISPHEGALEKHGPAKDDWNLPPPPTLPPPRSHPLVKSERSLESHLFRISGENVEKLKEKVASDPDAKGLITSASDMIQALFWRAAAKARAGMEDNSLGKPAGSNGSSILELPIDCRPFFSPMLPSSYMGNLLVIIRPNMPIDTLCSEDTSIGRVALTIRQTTSLVKPQLAHDAFTLLQTIPDYSQLNYAFMHLNGPDICITNLMLFPTGEISFGSELFESNGTPAAVRLLMEAFNTAFRMGVIFPIREDGGVDLMFSVFPEELQRLRNDKELAEYATYLG